MLQHLKRALGQSEEQIERLVPPLDRRRPRQARGRLIGTSGGGTGKFCHGDSPTMADCCLVPQIFNAKRYTATSAPYPDAMRVFDACMKLEAFDRAQPSKQPDAE